MLHEMLETNFYKLFTTSLVEGGTVFGVPTALPPQEEPLDIH
jgi:hypothetical protein